MSEPTELLPCPHCGIPVTLGTNNWYWWIERDCDCHDPTGSKEDVIAAWNRRTTPPARQSDHEAWHAVVAEMKAVNEGSATLAAAEYDALMMRLAEELSSVRPGA